MSLLDVDKNSHNRLNPSINQDDQMANRPAHDTVAHTYITDSQLTVDTVRFSKLKSRLAIPAQLVITNSDSIQDAIDYVDASGGGTVFLSNGTYTMSSDIVVPSNVNLVGATTGGVIIDFQNTSNQVRCAGTLVDTTGVVTVTNNSATVTGTNTVFDSNMIGSYIILRGRWYSITSVASATSLTVDPKFDGESISGISNIIADIVTSASIQNLTISGSTNVSGALFMRYTDSCTINGVTVLDSTIGINLRECSTMSAVGFYVSGCGVGISGNNSATWTLNNYEVYNCTSTNIDCTAVLSVSNSNATLSSATGANIKLTGCSSWALYDMENTTAGTYGIELISCTDIEIFAMNVRRAASDGIRLTASNGRVSIHNVSLLNNTGNGINVASSSNSKNTISMCFFSGNGGTVADSGTLTISVSNQT